MLTIRSLAMVCYLIASVVALANDDLQPAKSNYKAAGKDVESKKRQINGTPNTSSLKKAIGESIKETSEKREPNDDKKLENERRLVEYTGQLAGDTHLLAIYTLILACLTAVLAVIAIGQLVMFRRQLKYMRTGITYSRNQAKLARDEFHTTHLPKLVVRRVTFVDNPTRISYVITNVGDALGEIEESDILIRVDTGGSPLPFRPPYNYPWNGVLNGIKIPVGDTEKLEIVSPDLTDQISILESQTNIRIMLLGWMLYKNPGGSRRYTAFCRIYDHHLRGFVKPPETEHTPEYDRYEYIS